MWYLQANEIPVMKCQKHLFQLPEGIHYLNCACMSPLLKSVEEKGIKGMRRKRNPVSVRPVDFFTRVDEVREKSGRLTSYVEGYRPGAARYDMGQTSNFISVPMLNEAFRQLLDWGIGNVQEYGRMLSLPLLKAFSEVGIVVEDPEFRAHHLIGMKLPDRVNGETLVRELQDRKVYVSLRGNNIRISFNVFNNERDIEELISALHTCLQ